MWPKTKRTYRWLQPLIGLLLVGGVLFLLIKQIKKPLGPEDLKILLIDLRSQAAQGQLIADGALSNKTTTAYVRGQAHFLQDKTDEIIKEVTNAKPEPQLQEWVSRAGELARDVRAEFAKLLSFPQDQYVLEAIRQNLQEVVRQIVKLETSLSH